MTELVFESGELALPAVVSLSVNFGVTVTALKPLLM